MNINLNYTERKVKVHELLRKCGYKVHGKDWVLTDSTGRFHIKYDGDMCLDLHYDINVEWRHLSIPMPIRCGKEKKRIKIRMWKIFGVKHKDNGKLREKDWMNYIIKTKPLSGLSQP